MTDGRRLRHDQAFIVGTIRHPLTATQLDMKIADCLAWGGLSRRKADFSSAMDALPAAADVLACLSPLAEGSLK